MFNIPVPVTKSSATKKIQYWWQALAKTWRKYLTVTTIPGLQNVQNASGRLACTIWTLLFLVGFACTVRDVYITTSEYLAYPVITSMTMDQVVAIQFPSVTVCNLNRVHCSNLRKLVAEHWGTDLGMRLLELHGVTKCHLDFTWTPDDGRNNKHDRRSGTDDTFLNETSRTTRQYHRRTLDNYFTTEDSSVSTKVDDKLTTESTPAIHKKISVNQTESFNNLMHFMALYSNFSANIRKKLGHGFKDFIRSCTFSGKSCLNETIFFRHALNSAFGNCYTFSTDRKTVIPGRDYGLSMELYLDQKNYLGAGLSPQAGARLVVHNSEHHPLPEENGITVAPHLATSVALLEVRIKRLKLPYTTNCSSSWARTWYKERVAGIYAYSLERCQRICLQLAFEEKCNCSHPSYMDLPTGFGPCNLTSSSPAYVCATDILEEFENRNRTCSCNMDCSEIGYETRISAAMWPTDNYWCSVASKYSLIEECDLIDDEYGGTSQSKRKKMVQNNLLKIDVYFENLRVKSIEQSPTYKVQTFIGSLGGALSLYLGITLLMLVEVLEVFFRLIYSYFLHCWNKIFNPPQLLKQKMSKFHHSRRSKIKMGNKLPQPIFFTGRFTPPHQPIIRSRFVW